MQSFQRKIIRLVTEEDILWKHSDKNENNEISLHDCRTTQVLTKDNDLYFKFDDGFWILKSNGNNPYAKTLRTDASQLKLCNFDVSNIYVFHEFHLFRRLISIKRVSLNLEALMDNINSGKWELEFLYEYHTYHGVLYQCCIWSKRKPYHMEAQLIIDCESIEYFWNNLCEDKPW